MDMSKRLINLIGTALVVAILLFGSLLVVAPLFNGAHDARLQAQAGAESNRVTRSEVATLAEQDAWLEDLIGIRGRLLEQITPADELRDASALASAAAKAAGARILAITFADPQAFAPPAGVGLGDDGRPSAPQASAEPTAAWVQIPVTFEAEVSSTTQVAAFIDGLREGPRLVQVVQAQASPTNNVERLTVTVDVLIFAARA